MLSVVGLGLGLGLGLGFGLSACGSDDEPAAGGISVSDPWARATAEGQANGAVYMVLEAEDADRLVSASVPASVAAEAQIHEVVTVEPDEEMSGEMSGEMSSETSGDMSGGMEGMDATMRMQEMMDGLPLPAGEAVTLQPGSYHVMLLDLAEPLVAGDEVQVTLQFAEAGQITITAPVAESAP
jgi:copper(I)-binding protein